MSKVSGVAKTYIEIDGAQGEGGGQVLRTALSLSACRGLPVHIYNIRRGRQNPGLMRQHLACVKALAEVCGAQVSGASIGSQAIRFIPGVIKAGEYRFSVGSAGSTTLVFQTVLPALLLAGQPSRLVLNGGTHNPLAPSYDFIGQTFLPVLRQMGCGFEIALKRYGFYPVGAGEWSVTIIPPERFLALDLQSRGPLHKARAYCLGAGIPGHIMVREKERLLRRLKWADDAISIGQVESLGPGNCVLIQADYAHVSEVIESHGALGVRAEKVADTAVDLLRRYEADGAPVGHHLADQLLLPLCLGAGGTFVTGPLSDHCKTNIDVIRHMLGIAIRIEDLEPKKQWRIQIG